MRASTTTVRTIDLDRDQMLILDDPCGRMRVLHGSVWLTEAGLGDDHRVGAGEERPLGGRRTVIGALGPTRLQLTEEKGSGPAAPARAWRRIVRAARRQAQRMQFGPARAEPRV